MITYILIAASVLLSIAAFGNASLFDKLKYNPYQVKNHKEYYRIFSHGFIHGDYGHLFINMFVLWSFGTAVEKLFGFYFGSFGIALFLLLYFGGMLAASLPALKKHRENPYYNAVGASGSVAAVLFSYILMQPVSMLGLMLVIPIPAFLFGVLYLWYEAKMQNRRDGIAHDAHLFGALFGFAITLVYEPRFLLSFFSQIAEKLQNLF